MSGGPAILGAVLLAALLVGTLGVFPALRLGLRDGWRRTPTGRRGRAGAAALLTLAYVTVGATLAIVAPWGPASVADVLGVGGGCLMVMWLASVAVAAVREARRASSRRGTRR